MVKLKPLHIVLILLSIAVGFVVHFLTPMHSDDFYYSIQGIGIKTNWDFYLSWSGRLVANYIGALLMMIKSKITLSMIQALGLTALIYFISQLSSSRAFKKVFDLYTFFLIFVLYWLYHPDLGQSTFWVVGSANYLWTNLLISIYFYLLFNAYYNGKFSIATYIFPVLAGCTNENTAPITIFISLFILLVKLYSERKINIQLSVVVILNILGGAILLLSPGNRERLIKSEAGKEIKWSELSVVTKLQQFDSQYWELLKFPIIILLVIYLFIFLFQKIEIIDEKKKISFLSLSILFIGASVASNFIMFLSPTYPPRAMSGPFFFLLVAITFAFFELKKSTVENKKLNYIIMGFIVVLLFSFGKLYVKEILPFYKSAHEQNLVQLEVIEKAQKSRIDHVKIPRLYINNDVDWRIVFDTYEEPSKVAEYYGFSNVEFYPVEFDISKLTNDYRLESATHRKLITNTGLKNLYIYKTNKQTHFAIELSDDELKALKDNYRLFFHVFDKNDIMHNFDQGEIKVRNYNNKNYVFIHIPFKIKRIKRIDVGYFDKDDWNIRYSEVKIQIPKK